MPDKYSNIAYGTVTESAANTLTFSEIQTNVSVFEKIAWVVSKIEYYIPAAARTQLAVADDLIEFALTASNAITALSLNNPAVIDLYKLQTNDALGPMPNIRDFTTMPGGGRIVAPRPLYAAVKGTSLGAAVQVEMRIHFTTIELKADEYLELVDFYRIVQ